MTAWRQHTTHDFLRVARIEAEREAGGCALVALATGGVLAGPGTGAVAPSAGRLVSRAGRCGSLTACCAGCARSTSSALFPCVSPSTPTSGASPVSSAPGAVPSTTGVKPPATLEPGTTPSAPRVPGAAPRGTVAAVPALTAAPGSTWPRPQAWPLAPDRVREGAGPAGVCSTRDSLPVPSRIDEPLQVGHGRGCVGNHAGLSAQRADHRCSNAAGRAGGTVGGQGPAV